MGRLIFKLLIPFLFLYSCNSSSPRGYNKISSGVYFRLLGLGDDSSKPQVGDLIIIDFSFSNLNDSVFYRNTRKVKLESYETGGSINRCLLNLGVGDSAVFLFLSPDSFKKNFQMPVPDYFNHIEMIKMNVLVSGMHKEEDYLSEKRQFLEWYRKNEQLNKNIIKSFLEEERISVSPTSSGLYFVLLKVGRGKNPAKGDLIKVNYEGKFLNGVFFDSTIRQGEPLEFIYGEEYMVIKGLEEAIGMMREGDKALIIIPPDLAFGSKGAGEGIIPPHTALVYEVELLSVEQKF